MQISIKNDETCILAREVAEMTGESLTDTIKNALIEMRQKVREKKKKESKINMEELNKLLAEFDKLPVLDRRPHGEILYDKDGLPK